MASGSSNLPNPLPPPDYNVPSTEEFAKKRGPPLRGLIVDEAYPPSREEAEKVFSKAEVERRKREQEDAGLKPQQRRPYIPGPISRQPLVRPQKELSEGDNERPTDPYRSSGTSQIFNTAPSTGEIANTMPGGTAHTAGGEKLVDVSVREALKDAKPSDILRIHQQPCVREALLQGMTIGGLLGGGIWIVGRPTWKALNTAVWTSIVVSIGGYQYCQMQRTREKQGMKLAVQIVEEKREEKRMKMEERREAVAVKKMEEDERKRREEDERRKKGRLNALWGWWETEQKEHTNSRIRSIWKWWDSSEREEGRRREG
jgi:cytochrome c oxidase assembly protein subunit 20